MWLVAGTGLGQVGLGQVRLGYVRLQMRLGEVGLVWFGYRLG
jgi:hypothetical protein